MMSNSLPAKHDHPVRRGLLLALMLLGFSSGLPLALIGATLLTWFADVGVNFTTIGFMGLIAQPYVFKPLWAPLFDRFPSPFLGPRRGWILLLQLSLLLCISLLGRFDPNSQVFMIAKLGFLIAVLSASQDIVYDAYRTEVLNPEERGLGAAWGVAGYRLAMMASGGLALVLADSLGWQMTYVIMGCLMLVGPLGLLFSLPEPANVSIPQTIAAAVIEPFKKFFATPGALLFLMFIFFYKFAESFTSTTMGSLVGVFLLNQLEFSLTTIGVLNKFAGLVAGMLGLFAGGLVLTRLSCYKGLLYFGIAQAVTNLGFALLAYTEKSVPLLAVVIVLDNFAAGLGMAALIAFMMSLCQTGYTATQFALLTAVAGLPRLVAAPITAFIVNHLGWLNFFILTFVFALPAILLLFYLRTYLCPKGNHTHKDKT